MCSRLVVCVIWDSCRKQGGTEGVQFIFLWRWKKGEDPYTWLAQWADSSVNDVTTSCLTYLKWLWCHSCLFHSVSLYLCPPSHSLTQLVSLTLSVLALSLPSPVKSHSSSFYCFTPFLPLTKAHTQQYCQMGEWDRDGKESKETESSPTAKNPVSRD